MLAYTPVEFDLMENPANRVILRARQNQFIRENILSNAPVAIAMDRNSAFTGSYTENSFWYQKFDVRQSRRLRGGQPIVDFDFADNCCPYVTTMKTMNFQGGTP